METAGHELYRAKKKMRILRTSHRIKFDTLSGQRVGTV